jgi:hypothetical protein
MAQVRVAMPAPPRAVAWRAVLGWAAAWWAVAWWAAAWWAVASRASMWVPELVVVRAQLSSSAPVVLVRLRGPGLLLEHRQLQPSAQVLAGSPDSSWSPRVRWPSTSGGSSARGG